jgi:hypothetical protein
VGHFIKSHLFASLDPTKLKNMKPMEIQTNYYETRKELRISVMQIFPNLIRLKKYSDEAAFYDLLSEVVPEIRKYIIKRIKTAVQKNHFPKHKYEPDDFIDQLFIETYDHIEHISN